MSVELDDQLVAIARELDVQSPPLTLTDLRNRNSRPFVSVGDVEHERRRSVLLLAASLALVVGGVVAVLAVAGNDPDSATQSPSGSLTSVDSDVTVAQDSCTRPRQSVSFIVAWMSVPDDTVFVSACALDEAMRVANNPLPINVFSSASANEAIAWLYVACGLEGGFVEVGAARPANCAELSGVQVEDTAPINTADVAVTAGPLTAHPRLECAEGETQYNPPSEYSTDQPGAVTVEDALRPVLENVAAALDGQVVRVSDVEYGVMVEGRIVEIAKANETRPGEWHFVDDFFCG